MRSGSDINFESLSFVMIFQDITQRERERERDSKREVCLDSLLKIFNFF